MTARLSVFTIVVAVLTLGCPVLSAAETARSEATPMPRRWAPTVSLALGSFDELLRVRVDGVDYTSYRGQLRTFVALGLAHPVLRLADERVWIDGHAAVGVGPAFSTGHWHVPLREDVSLAFAASHWLTLRGGLGVGVTIDATASERSFAEFALPIGVTFFRTLELVYRPMLSVPLGSERSPVFGGERELATRPAVLPFELLLRYRIPALSW